MKEVSFSLRKMWLKLFLLLIIQTFLVISYAQGQSVNKIDSVFIALKALYKATDGDNWNNNRGWDTTAVPVSMILFDDWHGIKASQLDIIEIKLYDNNLSGIIPPEIGNLINLKELELDSNDLSGNIPPEIGNLIELRWLYLDNNNLSGIIPPEIGNLINLKELDLPKNDLSGNIPPEIGNLINLKELHLYENDLSGNIPPEIGNLTELIWLNFYDNKLSGNIPPEIGNLINLKELDLFENNLSGNIPPEIGNLTELILLYLYDNDFSGNIPPEIGKLINLEQLSLYDNSFSGSLPQTMIQLRNLLYFDFENSGLCAPINDEFQTWINGISYYDGSDCVSLVSVKQKDDLPNEFVIYGNYPNPFTGSTKILFDLPAAANISVSVIDMLGRTTNIKSQKTFVAGRDKRLELDTGRLASGTYLYRLNVSMEGQSFIRSGIFSSVR